ncbi:hypothetical protein KZI27_14125 [Curtobacterium sp. TC1]|uniref:hypothetical protein n=1 Tax=Curtobacterium sp. TC1 TaxID=2862880 RepID=UPI001C9B5D26|nr:hypothetical protein [Curtobacterium sp. TC1]QZQ54439.1 hypothetical protein KZI27_14125 [Curtobacterium sp. TC1]
MNQELSEEQATAGFAIINGQLVYTPTGEPCDDFEQGPNPDGSPYIQWAVRRNLEAIVGDDPSRFPPAGWLGTIEDLAVYMGISAEEAASAYKHSPEAMLAARCIIGWSAPPTRGDMRRLIR